MLTEALRGRRGPTDRGRGETGGAQTAWRYRILRKLDDMTAVL